MSDEQKIPFLVKASAVVVGLVLELGVDLALSWGAAAGINYLGQGYGLSVSTVPVFVGVLTVKCLRAAVK